VEFLLSLAPKPLKVYNRKSKESRFSKMDDSLVVEVVSRFVKPTSSPLYAPFVKTVQVPETASDVRKTPCQRGFLWRVFLGPSYFG
jgi:hypothetical protein